MLALKCKLIKTNMTHIFAILYAISAVGSVVACLPQIIQVLKTKTVEGISLQTYDMWFVMQAVSMPYIVQSGDSLWITANIVWIAYYLAMALLIQHYRYPHYISVVVGKLVSALRLVPVLVRPRH